MKLAGKDVKVYIMILKKCAHRIKEKYEYKEKNKKILRHITRAKDTGRSWGHLGQAGLHQETQHKQPNKQTNKQKGSQTAKE